MVEILLCLDQSKTPQAVRDVSCDTEYSKGMISRCVENLRQQGYVTVERNVQDRRAVCIALTEKAKPVIADFHAKEKEMIETLYAYFERCGYSGSGSDSEIVQANIADM